MSAIGAFTKGNDGFTGEIKTLNIKVKAKLVPSDKSSDKAPDYRALVGATEFGAGWKKVSAEGRDYVSVKLDDPSWPAPIFGSLVESEDEPGVHYLFWSRRPQTSAA